MKKKICIHFVTDEKFIKDEIQCFESANLTTNSYYYVGNTNKRFEFISDKDVKIISKDDVAGLFATKSIDVICLHNLYSLPFELIAVIPKEIIVIWYAWGFDLYSNPAPLNPLLHIGERYMSETFKINKIVCFKSRIKLFIKKSIQSICYDNNHIIDEAKTAISRIDYFAGVFPVEYEMLKDVLPYFRAQKITHNYIHPQEFKLSNISLKPNITGKNILLGNSASMYGNHIDIMNQIAPYVENDTLIICPLSYAGKPKYIRKVISHGKQLFGERFMPLMKYLSFEEYTKIMNSCNRFVMGMIQQAATCNCLTSIWDGIKIYAPKNSMNYVHYNSLGIKVYSIEDDFGREIDEQYVNLENNRKIIENFYSYRRWFIDLEDSLSIIFNK